MRNCAGPLSLALFALIAAGCAAAPSKTIVIPANFDRAYDEYHYAPAVRFGDTVIVSGIPAGPGPDYETQVRNMFKRLKSTLEAAGATLDDVVDISTFHTGPTDTKSFTAEYERFMVIHREYFPHGYPAWTAVGTTALLVEGAPVEMRVVAVVGAGKNLKIQRAAKPAAPVEPAKP